MIKATAGDALIIGLTERNLELLRLGRPIYFPASQFQRPELDKFRIVIMYGKTEQAIIAELQEVVDGGKDE